MRGLKNEINNPTYDMKKLILLLFISIMFTCSDDENNIIDDPIIGSWKGILHQNTPDETEELFTFMSNGILSYSSVDEIEEGTTTHSINCGGEWYNASSNVDFSVLTQRYYLALDDCSGEGFGDVVTIGDPVEINFVFNNNFTSFSVQNDEEETIYIKQ